MAMLHMQRISIYGLKKDRKAILEMLQRRGVVEIKDADIQDDVFNKTDVSNIKAGLERNISTAKDAVEIITHYVNEKKPLLSFLNGKKIITVEDYNGFRQRYDDTIKTANEILAKSKEIAELKAEIQKLEIQTEMLAPWTSLDIPLNFSDTRFTKSFIGTLPKLWTMESLYEALAAYMPLNIDIISSSKEQTCIFVMCKKEKADGVYDLLRSLEFSLPGTASDKAPAEQIRDIEKLIAEHRKKIAQAEARIVELAKYKEDLLFLEDYDRMRADKYEVIGQLAQSRNLFILTGYIAERDSKAMEEELGKKYMTAVELEEPSKKEDVPVLLKNNGFARPLEWVVESFSLPGKGEIDPTMVMALFYYLLFGIIMADAGYGALITVVCAVLLIKYGKKMEASMNNFLTMFLYCGISTIFWGMIFGSYFGDLIDTIAVSFFGATNTPILPPLWFVPMNEPMRMLAFSMGLGLIHLLTGLVMKAYQLFRQKDYKAIFYDAASWFVLVVSCTLILLSMDMIKSILGVTFVIPKAIVKISEVAAILAAIIIVATNGRESRNPFKRFLKGLYALYGISGYLSDVLSYSRLLALGLASGVICSVVNKIAGMVSGAPLGFLWFVLIVVAGHLLNFAIGILGAYVHTNRLQYVEFFGKFYEGGGRAFHPFNMNTKYFKVKESVKNEI